MNLIKIVLSFTPLGEYLYFSNEEKKGRSSFEYMRKLTSIWAYLAIGYGILIMIIIPLLLIPVFGLVTVYFLITIYQLMIFLVLLILLFLNPIVRTIGLRKIVPLDSELKYIKLAKIQALINPIPFVLFALAILCIIINFDLISLIIAIIAVVFLIIDIVMFYNIRIKIYVLLKNQSK